MTITGKAGVFLRTAFLIGFYIGVSGFSLWEKSENPISKENNQYAACRKPLQSFPSCYESILRSYSDNKFSAHNGKVDDFIKNAESTFSSYTGLIEKIENSDIDDGNFKQRVEDTFASSDDKFKKTLLEVEEYKSMLRERGESFTAELEKLSLAKVRHSNIDPEFDKRIIDSIHYLEEAISENNKRIEKLDLLSETPVKLSSRREKFSQRIAAIDEKDRKCMIREKTCRQFKNEKNIVRTPELDEAALLLIKMDLLEAALNGSKTRISPATYVSDVKSLGNTNSLKKAVLINGYRLMNYQITSGHQSHSLCLQMRAFDESLGVTFKEMLLEKGDSIFQTAFNRIKDDLKSQPPKWAPSYAYDDGIICRHSDEKLKLLSLEDYAKSKGMKGYINGLRTLTSEARLPLQYVGYLVYADGEDDYTVTQSFGSTALASSADDSTPLIIDFGSEAPLSEGSDLEGLYLRLIKIGPYTTAMGAPRNAFFFKVVDAPQLPRVVKLR